MPEPELLPCPFCGSTNVKFSATDDWVGCGQCGSQGPCVGFDGSQADGERAAIAAWNRRLSPLAAEVVAGLSAFADHLDNGGTVDDWPGTHTRIIDDETT